MSYSSDPERDADNYMTALEIAAESINADALVHFNYLLTQTETYYSPSGEPYQQPAFVGALQDWTDEIIGNNDFINRLRLALADGDKEEVGELMVNSLLESLTELSLIAAKEKQGLS